MIFAVGQLHFEVDDREADQRSGLRRFAHALFDRRDIFLGNVAALDVVGEDKARTALARVTEMRISANWPEPPDCFLWV